MRHDFISYDFLQHIHARDVRRRPRRGFLKDQFLICANLAAAPLWLAGLVGFLLNRRYRMLALMYLVPLALFLIAKGRGYYTAGAYPMLLAMGAAICERWLGSLPRWGRRSIEIRLLWRPRMSRRLHLCAVDSAACIERPATHFALNHNGDLREEIGWNELVRTVARIRDSLPPDQQAHLGITTGNYGEYGAIDILGRAYGSASADRHHELRVVARLSNTAANDHHCSWAFDRSRPKRSLPVAGSPAITATQKEFRTRRAETIRISSFAGRRGSPGPQDGKSIGTLADAIGTGGVIGDSQLVFYPTLALEKSVRMGTASAGWGQLERQLNTAARPRGRP